MLKEADQAFNMIGQEHSTSEKAGRIWLAALFLFILGNVSFPLTTQEKIHFEQISSEQGLSQNTVFTICQDKKGFLWLGTEEGLNRYDGYDIKIYKHKTDDPHSLIDNKVWAVYEDHLGALWIGTPGGLDRFDRKTEKFIHLISNKIRSIYEDRDGVLWLGSYNAGLISLDRERKNFKYYTNTTSQLSGLNDKSVRTIYEDKSGLLWIGAEKHGLYKFDRDKEIFTHYLHMPTNPQSLSHNSVKAIFEDSRGVLWIGTEDGLNRMDRQKGVFIHYKSNSRSHNSLSHDYVLSIFEDDAGILWFGTYGGGLNRYDLEKKIFLCDQYRADIPGSLSDNNVYVIYQDRGGILWFGTNRGLNKYDKRKEKFSCWSAERAGSTIASNNCVWSIYKDRSGIVWFGTDSGLAQLDRKSGKMKLWSHDPNNPNSMSHSKVLAIYEDHAGVLWIGTEGGGLNRFDRQKKTFSSYKNDPNDEYSLSHDDVFALYEDRFGTLWIGTEKGLNRLDREEDRFNRWLNDPANPRSLSNDVVSFIFEDHNGELWIGTRGSLNRFNRADESFDSWKNIPGDPSSLSDNQINYLYEDKAGNFWIGTALGLNKFDRRGNHFTHYTTKDGLPNDKINGILEDDNGCLWLSTNYGISRFNPKEGQFRNYDIYDGLQSNEFNGNSCNRAFDGELFFGGINGFNYFDPLQIKDKLIPPPIVITDFQLFNESANIDSGRETPLEKSILETDEIELSHTDYFFAFKFAALDFTTPSKNKYEYMMEGLDKTWIKKSADNRYASYTNLDPDTYTFKVRGSNNDGIWNEKGVSIKIVINPPFWKTWWFQSIVGLCCLLLIFGFFQYRTRRLRQKLAEERKVQEILRKARDLAEFRRAEIEKLVAAISSLLIAVDSEGKIFQWNETAAKFFCIIDSACIGKTLIEVLKEYIEPTKLAEIMQKGLADGEGKPLYDLEIAIDLKDKGGRLLLAVINPILDSDGKKLGFLLLAEDITNRKEEERRRNLSQRLESLGQMAGNIAHQIKTPLQFIGNNGQFLCDSFSDISKFYMAVLECLPEIEQSDKKQTAALIKQAIEQCDIEYHLREIPEACNQVVDGVATVSNVIQSMKEYFHPGTGVMEKADVNKLLRSTIVIVQNEIKKILNIEMSFYPELPQIPCYQVELNQVFMNLLGNAVDAIKEKEFQGMQGVIKVSTTLEGSEIIITITDNGCGIPDSIKEFVFNPFFTTKDVGKGTGQGLSLAHNIVEKHKGKIYFKSKIGEGTSFYVHLPILGEN
jgi:PAS domain S-box-containing protein